MISRPNQWTPTKTSTHQETTCPTKINVGPHIQSSHHLG